jgi:hypothetical protein
LENDEAGPGSVESVNEIESGALSEAWRCLDGAKKIEYAAALEARQRSESINLIDSGEACDGRRRGE